MDVRVHYPFLHHIQTSTSLPWDHQEHKFKSLTWSFTSRSSSTWWCWWRSRTSHFCSLWQSRLGTRAFELPPKFSNECWDGGRKHIGEEKEGPKSPMEDRQMDLCQIHEKKLLCILESRRITIFYSKHRLYWCLLRNLSLSCEKWTFSSWKCKSIFSAHSKSF